MHRAAILRRLSDQLNFAMLSAGVHTQDQEKAMKIIFGTLLALASLGVMAQDKAAEPAAKETPKAKAADAPIPEKVPAKESEGSGPTVSIRTRDNGDVVEEYREGGIVRMVKVTPTRGKPYYIMDNNGDGRLDRADAEAAGGVVPVSWIIATW